MSAVDRVAELLKQCGGSRDSWVQPPTALFNEGWMLRLVLDWASRHRTAVNGLTLAEGSRWFSEALLGSRFRPRRRGDLGGEGFTHADGVIGHFKVRDRRGDIELLPGARQFVVVEAKMGSGLSFGTTRAPEFNQAARNVSCIAHALTSASAEADGCTDVGFVVIAPQSRVDERVFVAVEHGPIRAAVEARAKAFDADAAAWFEERFLPVLDRCRLNVVSWETVLEQIAAVDEDSHESLNEFYRMCLEYNLPRSAVAR